MLPFATIIFSLCLAATGTASSTDHNSTESTAAADQHARKVLHLTANSNLLRRLQPPRSDGSSSLEVPWRDEEKCLNGGKWRESEKVCECTWAFDGDRCELRVCLNGGILSADGRSCRCTNYTGPHCEQPACIGGILIAEGRCECRENYFGRFCELFCAHGRLVRLVDGNCACYDGTEGVTCAQCNGTLTSSGAGECAQLTRRRRPVMQSRFALSGLSLCLITIILLWISVVTRRRRTLIAASHFERLANERLLREQQRRLCEHRAVAVQAPRSSRSRPSSEFRHFIHAARSTDSYLLCSSSALLMARQVNAPDLPLNTDTPPPMYCAMPEEAPPSYEEATREATHTDDDSQK